MGNSVDSSLKLKSRSLIVKESKLDRRMLNALEPSTSTPSVVLLLTLKANKLRDKDVFSKSDPMCVVSQFVGRLTGNGHWKECGRTERLQNSLNPEWATQIRIEYFFEEKQSMKFEVYDIDSKSTELSAHDFLGRMECDLAEIVSNRPFIRPLSGLRGTCGELTIWSEEVDEGSKENVLFHLSARKLDKKDFFGKSDPFLNIYRVNDDGSRLLVYRTEAIMRELNPTWKPFEVNVKSLCAGDRSRPFLVECFDYDRDGGHDFIGSCEVSLSQLLSNAVKSLPLISEKKKAKKGDKYKNSGTLEFDGVQILKQHTFLDFISGGTQLDFAVAVDFTASNGAVHKPTSLHCINPSQPNQYEIAIRAVIDICQHYNNSKLFDAFGFGAILPPETCVSPIFALNFDANPAVVGLPGVMEVYRFALNRVKLYGPTNFAPVIKEVAKKAAKFAHDGARYQVLLIITDGAISDMAATKSAIIAASSLPLSIIIVGVGNDEFENMNELDSDDRMLSHAGRTAQRDIVQFVPLRNFLHQGCTGAESERVMGLLAKEVLAEIPLQLTSYMKKRNIVPRPADNPFPKDSEAVFKPSMPPAMPYPAVAPQYSGQQGPYPGPQPLPAQYPIIQNVPSQYPTMPQLPQASAGYMSQVPPQPQPVSYPYPMQPFPTAQQPMLYQPYPNDPSTYAFGGGMTYPAYPGTAAPGGYVPQQMLIQQSAAPSAPTAPPVDLSDIQPQMDVPDMRNLNLGH
ncbi:hypothetical protein RB195_000940 [Necator americanus]|uniref:C2 domain protein n=1 Tax=Necator americanus TaxID=51031 RepID=A0ABR1DC01_NECAM